MNKSIHEHQIPTGAESVGALIDEVLILSRTAKGSITFMARTLSKKELAVLTDLARIPFDGGCRRTDYILVVVRF